MASPITPFNNFISELRVQYSELSIEDLKKELYKFSIMIKEYPEENLILVYHKYDIPTNTKLEEICRSLVIDFNTFEVISFSCQAPICNKPAEELLKANNLVELN